MSARRTAWLSLLMAALVLVAAGFIDRQLKTASHPGFLPENMPLYVYAADLPLSWLHFSRTPLAKNLAGEASPVLHSMELSLRQWSGIRPTPARWRTWLGGSMAAATDGRDWILCTRPGIAARAASLVFSGKAFRASQLHQAWRGGYLLLSSSSALIKKALAAPPVTMDIPEAVAADTLVVETNTPLRMVLTVTPSPDLPVEARLFSPKALVPRPSAAWSPPPLPGNPAFLLSLADAQSAAQLAALVTAMNLPDFTGGLLDGLATRWGLSRVSPFLAASGPMNAPLSCALYGLSTASGAPLPQLALASAAKEGFNALLSPSRSSGKLLPYEWSGCAGWMFPLLGDQFSLYGFQRDTIHHLATQEPLAAMLAAAAQTPLPDIEDDMVITLDWKRATTAMMDAANWAAARELLRELNPKDLEAGFMPVMRALSSCGTLQATGRWTPEALLCKGALTGRPHPEYAP